jgi:hypothetical protein
MLTGGNSTRLYQIQLEAAQQEIYRAQDVLDTVDKQRLDAEKEAAELRSKNRKLLEDARLQRAKEQGRLQGMREGLEKGRDLGLLEGRLMGYSPYPPPQQHDMYDVHDGTLASPDSGVSHRSHSRSQTPRPSSRRLCLIALQHRIQAMVLRVRITRRSTRVQSVSVARRLLSCTLLSPFHQITIYHTSMLIMSFVYRHHTTSKDRRQGQIDL